MSNHNLNRYPLGIRFCRRGSLPCLETNNSQCSCSIAIGDAKRPASIKRKYFTDFGLYFLWKFNLPRTPCSLSPLPIYTISPLVSPSSYIPCTLGTSFNLTRVKGDHLFGIGIVTSCNYGDFVKIALITTQHPSIIIINPLIQSAVIDCCIGNRLYPMDKTAIPNAILARLLLSRTNLDHSFFFDILPSPYMKTTLQSCYNTPTYKSPPVMEQGRLELPRQLASKPQTCHVCQFHHCSEMTAEGTGNTQDNDPSADLTKALDSRMALGRARYRVHEAKVIDRVKRV